jgi:hypothetical protein
MGYAPRFAFCERPAFVGFAMHVVRWKPSDRELHPEERLAALTGILNSKFSEEWFRRFAKHRGASLDISGTLLKRFPLPAVDPEAESALARLVRRRQQMESDPEAISRLEAEIETLVRSWYGA